MEGLLRAMTDVMNSYTTLDNVWAVTVDVDGPTRFGRYFSSQNSYGTPDASETGFGRVDRVGLIDGRAGSRSRPRAWGAVHAHTYRRGGRRRCRRVGRLRWRHLGGWLVE